MKSNCKIVNEKIRKHITEYYTRDELTRQVQALNYKGNIYNAGVAMVEGACFLIYNDDIRKFLDSLDLNNKSNKNFDDDEVWTMYKHLIAREIEKIVKE